MSKIPRGQQRQKGRGKLKRRKLRPRDDVIPEGILKALQGGVKEFKREPRHIQARLAWMVWRSDSKRRFHRKDEDSFSIGYRELEQLFGRNTFHGINKRLKVFETTPNWWAVKHQTRAYRLTDPVKQIMERYLRPRRQSTERMIGLDGRALRRLPKPIAAKDTEGVTIKVWHGVDLPNKVPVDLDGLRRLYAQMKRERSTQQGDLFIDADPDDLTAVLRYLAKLIKLANTDIAGLGFVGHRYREASTGRLYAIGESLQTIPREIKKAALHGLYEYDFSNCHFAIFNQMAERYGYQCRAIRYYTRNKTRVRQEIAARVGISIEHSKQALIALMYGAKINPWYGKAIIKMVKGRAPTLFNDRQFKAIHRDIKKGRQRILRDWRRKTRTGLINDLGKRVVLNEKPEIRLAHLIQGVEAKALRAVCDLYPVVLPMHDGFITQNLVDKKEVERLVRETTGYRLKLESTMIYPSVDRGFPKRVQALTH